MDKEIRSCEENETWVVVPRPAHGVPVIDVKWVYRIKLDEFGSEDKLKSRITPKGYMQVRGIDYFEIFAPTVRYKTLRILLSLVVEWDYELVQLDVNSAFLKADIKEDVYCEIPEGYTAGATDGGQRDYVLKLRKALYGIHQAPREWYLLVRDFITKEMGMIQCTSDPCLFWTRTCADRRILMVMFVDDYQAAYDKRDLEEWLALKVKFTKRFATNDIGDSRLMLGMRITRDRENRTLLLDQEVYVKKMLERFGMQDCKEISTPEAIGGELDDERGPYATPADSEEEAELMDRRPYMQLVGALLYATLSTRPDIAHAVHQLTKHTQRPQVRHWQAAKRVLRYLQGTSDIALRFGRTEHPRDDHKDANEVMTVSSYADADFANDKSDRKSVSGWAVKLNGDLVNWSCKKQSTVALSTCEAELYAEASCIQEVLWLRHLLAELELDVQPQSIVWGDNQSTLQISENGVIGERTKHIDIKYKFICENIESDTIKVAYIRTEKQQADIFTKALRHEVFERHRASLMTR